MRNAFDENAIHFYTTYEQLLKDYVSKDGDKELLP